jgi:anion-transporting  ArsA/GET3 family ATPase
MLTDEFLGPRILIVTGKGGVGKTTVAAAIALIAARSGRKVCVAEVDRKATLSKLFGAEDVGYEPAELSPGVWGINVTPEPALAEYLQVQYRMKRFSKAFTSTHFVDYITTAAPGLKDILVLGKVWYLEQGRSAAGTKHEFDNIVVDAPAAGHMVNFLSAPTGLSDAVRVGPIRRQSDWLNDMLRDPKRSRVHLVTLPEEMPVAETLETATALRDRLRITTGVVFTNAVYGELLTAEEQERLDHLVEDGRAEELVIEAKGAGLTLDDEDVDALVGYARFLQARRGIQAAHLKRLKKGVNEEVVELPFLFSAGLALPDVETLADAVESRIEEL